MKISALVLVEITWLAASMGTQLSRLNLLVGNARLSYPQPRNRLQLIHNLTVQAFQRTLGQVPARHA